MWRPFASSLVEHSLESFIKKHGKSKSTVVYSPVYTKSPKTDIKANPFQLSQEDVDKRLTHFKELKKKVFLQRKQIKINDNSYQHNLETQLKYKRKVRENQFLKESEMTRIKSQSTKKKSELIESEPELSFTSSGDKKISSTIIRAGETVKTLNLPPLLRKSM
ncbi:hypothetical protein SteCoe_4114 [Stentor coeruleus]|uniref:Uncharacterized protein n=1 Tax=Stentor coeruleus TaxID=5963 RepID=A0A1R2CVN5_9CILI|nr:hypothetical protein SteCoe_4114 [Stentor coeruleus]